MTRIEIIANISVEAEIQKALVILGLDDAYTKIPKVIGKGKQGIRNGDVNNPEINFMLLIYTNSDQKADKLRKAVNLIKKKNPKKGIKIFMMS